MFLWCLVSTRLICANPVKVERTVFEHIKPTEICLAAWWTTSTGWHKSIVCMCVCTFKPVYYCGIPLLYIETISAILYKPKVMLIWPSTYKRPFNFPLCWWMSFEVLHILKYHGKVPLCIQIHISVMVGVFWHITILLVLFLPTNCIGVIKYADPISFPNSVMWYTCVNRGGKNGFTLKMRNDKSKASTDGCLFLAVL